MSIIEPPTPTPTVFSPRLRLLGIEDVATATGVPVSTVYQQVVAGKFPKPFKVGRLNKWRESTLIAFLDRAERKAGGAQ